MIGRAVTEASRLAGRVAVGAGLVPLVLVVTCLMAADLLAQAAASGPEVVEVRFSGAVQFQSGALASAIATRATACRTPALLPACLFGAARDRRYLDERALQADVVRLRLFYFQRGYRDARVDVAVVPVSADGQDAEPIAFAAARQAPSDPRLVPAEVKRVRVLFRIEEGSPVRVASIEVAGAESRLPPDIAQQLPLQLGRPFNLLAYEESRDSLRAALRNDGHPGAEVLAGYLIPIGSQEAQVRFDVVPGLRARFGTIEVTGNERVSDGVVRRVLTFREGHAYRHAELMRSQQNLFDLAVFRHAEIRTDGAGTTDTLVPVRVLVSEGNTRRVRLGAGVSTADCVNAEGRWISRNFMGGARRLELRGQISNVLADPLGTFPCFDTGEGLYRQLSGLVGADMSQPWFLGTRNTLRAGLFMERRSVPEVFVRTTQGGYLAVERAFGRSTEVGAGYRPELTKLEAEGDLFFCVNFVICAERDIQVLQDRHLLAPVSLSFARNRTDSRFEPTSGFMLRTEAEVGARATGSDFSFVRVAGELRAFHEVAPGLVAAGRIRPGWAYSLREPGGAGLGLHPQKRFFAGGPNSVRGFAQHRLGPKVLTVDAAHVLAAPLDEGGAGCTVAQINSGTCDPNPVESGFEVRPVGGAGILEGSFELRFPVTPERLRGAAFLDFGQIWSEGVTPGPADLAWTPGAGLRYMSPIGPLRVDLGYNTSGGEMLPVITTEVEATASGVVNTPVLRNLSALYDWRPRDSLLNRLQLHISIGQAF